MKAHRVKLKMTSKEDVEKEFNDELNARLWRRSVAATEGQGLIPVLKFHSSDEYEQMRVEEKLKLMQEWYAKGRNTSFSSETMGELIYKKYTAK